MFMHTRLTRWATPLQAAIVVLALLAPSSASAGIHSAAYARIDPEQASSSAGALIVENAGQWPAAARFQVWGSPLGAGTTWLAQDGIWVVARRQASPSALALKLTFPGSNPNVGLEPLDPQTTTVSYILGNDPAQWRPAVPVWGGVRYVDLYPGVDLVLGQADSFWRLEARPGAATGQIRVQVEGVAVEAMDGNALRLALEGEPLFLALPQASFPYRVAGFSRQGKPLALEKRPIRSAPQPSRPGDDPADLLYSTFLGGSSDEHSYGIAVDGAGNTYVTGWTASSDFPTTTGAFDPSFNGVYDAYVVKLNPAGSGLLYATFLGGSAYDYGSGIAIDEAGSAYVTGTTQSGDFPITSNAFDPSHNGAVDVFVARLSPDGSGLDYATFLGGSNRDSGHAIAVDGGGSMHVMGDTRSNDFPTTPDAFDPSFNGTQDAFITKLNPAGSALVYSTFLGGSSYQEGFGFAIDGAGSAYVTGGTWSSDFPTTPGAFDSSLDGDNDAFATKLDPTGSSLVYSTFLGGGDIDWGFGLAIDSTGNAFVTGGTGSNDFPTTPRAFDPVFNGGLCEEGHPCSDVFVAKLNSLGNGLGYATYLGGTGTDIGYAVAVDGQGSAYVAGDTNSSEFPTTPGVFDPTFNGGSCEAGNPCGDAFAARLNPAGSQLVYATFLGGSSSDGANAIALDAALRAYLVGDTVSDGFPTTPGAFDTTYNGGSDAFVARLVVGDLADLDGDGRVTVFDLVTIASVWGQASVFDLDGDGLVTIVDVMIVAANWEEPLALAGRSSVRPD